MEEIIGNIAVFKRKILKSKVENYGNSIIKTSEIERIEFESLRNVLKKVDNLFFLLNEKPKEEYYYLYQKYER